MPNDITTGLLVLPLLVLIISTYIVVRLFEITANESRDDGRPFLRTIAFVGILLVFVSCGTVMLSDQPILTP